MGRYARRLSDTISASIGLSQPPPEHLRAVRAIPRPNTTSRDMSRPCAACLDVSWLGTGTFMCAHRSASCLGCPRLQFMCLRNVRCARCLESKEGATVTLLRSSGSLGKGEVESSILSCNTEPCTIERSIDRRREERSCSLRYPHDHFMETKEGSFRASSPWNHPIDQSCTGLDAAGASALNLIGERIVP